MELIRSIVYNVFYPFQSIFRTKEGIRVRAGDKKGEGLDVKTKA